MTEFMWKISSCTQDKHSRKTQNYVCFSYCRVILLDTELLSNSKAIKKLNFLGWMLLAKFILDYLCISYRNPLGGDNKILFEWVLKCEDL